MPKKKYLVTLEDDEREQLEHLLHSGTHATRKVTRCDAQLFCAGVTLPAFCTFILAGNAFRSCHHATRCNGEASVSP